MKLVRKTMTDEEFIQCKIEDWSRTLELAEKGKGPWPLPTGHLIFKVPEQYEAEFITESFQDRQLHAFSKILEMMES